MYYYSFCKTLAFTCHNKNGLYLTTEPLAVDWEYHFHYVIYEERRMGENTNYLKILILGWTRHFCYYYYYGDSTDWALLKHGRKRVWDIKLWFYVEIIWTFVDNFASAGKWTYSKNDSVTNSFDRLAWGVRNSNYSYCKESY